MYFGMYDSAQHLIQSNPDTFGNVPVTLSTFACGSIGACALALLRPRAHVAR